MSKPDHRATPPGGTERNYDAVIVGAGFAGMYMLHRLRELGLRARAFDTAAGVGGTWYWNCYPGARCDIVSLDYSYSFSDDIQQEWTWSEKYASQPEILAYANFVADKLDLRRDIQFNTRIHALQYDDDSATWTATAANGDRFTSRFCIMATGCLSTPKTPDIAGLDQFSGQVLSTSTWPQVPVDFSGLKVGLIGTGSSGIQVAPEIAQHAAELVVFQRTPSFTLPARNQNLGPELIEDLKSHYAERRELTRRSPVGHSRPITDRKTFSVDEQTRRQLFENAWASGGLDIFGAFGDLLVDEQANAEITRYIYEKIDQQVSDAAVAEKLKPRSYPFGARRVCLDSDYYAMFNRDNVTLVDLVEEPLEQIVADGVRTARATYNLDVLVLAVGFDAFTGSLLAIDITGRDGVLLRDKWSAGPISYLGLGINGFPNFFTITGPGSPSVLTNVIASIEQHVDWLTGLMTYMKENGIKSVEPDSESETCWAKRSYDSVKDSLVLKADSWYLGANVPGKPRVFLPFAGGLDKYRKICDEVAASGYTGWYFENGGQD